MKNAQEKSRVRKLKNYIGRIEDYGCITSPTYNAFENEYIRHIKKLCTENDWNYISSNKGHYEFSCVIQRNDGVYVYISICDVRYNCKEWFNNVLIRTMEHPKDWRGGSNHYSELELLVENIEKLR